MNRGRFQAQGGGIEKSVSWSRIEPINKSDAIDSIGNLEAKLSASELKARTQCFKNAYNFVGKTPKCGINASFKHSFTPFPPKRDIRVDIDVFSGTAFID